MGDPAVAGEVLLEGSQLFPEDEPSPIENARERLIDLGADLLVLRPQIG